MKIYTNGLMTKIAAMPIYGENLLLQNQWTDCLWNSVWVHQYYEDCSNGDLGLTFVFLRKGQIGKLLIHRIS